MLLIYSSKITPRLSYVCYWIFDQLTQEWKLTTDWDEFNNASGEKIIYNKSGEINSGLTIRCNEIITDDLINTGDPVKSMIGDMPVLFGDKTDFGFDIFSAVFYMLSRYEEYLPFVPDKFGRFPASESFAFRNSFLELPVCDMWVDYLKEKLREVYKDIQFKKARPSCILTYDLDVVFKYKGRNFVRQSGAIVKDLCRFRLKKITERIRVIGGKTEDPWDISEFVRTQLQKVKSKCIFFIPASKRSEYDRNLNPVSGKFKMYLNNLRSFAVIGIHPSYFSSDKENLISIEKDTLQNIAGSEILASRQHFLRFRIPETYFIILKSGIREEYSMAFPDMPGFRAGTSHPFKFYDLKNEVETDLMVFPSCIMDHTCISYLKYDSDQSWNLMKKFIDLVFKYRGIFIPIFHNNYLESAEWKNLHDRMTSYLQKIQNDRT